jgi:hypothetical protein
MPGGCRPFLAGWIGFRLFLQLHTEVSRRKVAEVIAANQKASWLEVLVVNPSR